MIWRYKAGQVANWHVRREDGSMLTGDLLEAEAWAEFLSAGWGTMLVQGRKVMAAKLEAPAFRIVRA